MTNKHTTLTSRDRRILRHLAQHSRGLPVRNEVVELFGTYESVGLVDVSAAKFGPLGLHDSEYFLAKITRSGVAALKDQTDV